MNSKRSYLDTLNAGRQRRPHTTLEELNRSLENLEQRLDRNRDQSLEFYRGRQAAEPRYPRTEPLGRDEVPSRASAYADRMAPEQAYGRQRPTPPAYEERAQPHMRHQQPYQGLARDIDRVRGQEDGLAAVGRIATELRDLRDELNQQMTHGLQRQFDGLRSEIHRALREQGDGKDSAELGLEFERLSGAIQTLAEKSDDRNVNMLRLELEQVKGALDTLAREESLHAMGRRWDEFDRRWTDFEDRAGAYAAGTMPGIEALTSRLEQIGKAVENLPESLSLRTLEEKVRMLASAVDHFAGQKQDSVSETWGQIDERLDEISRAIVASTVAAQSNSFDPEPLDRIEQRIEALARQIEEVSDDRPGDEVLDRLSQLAMRVDALASHANLPEQALDRLGHQIARITERMDSAPAFPDVDYVIHGIEQRFDALSAMLERRQGDAIEQGNGLLRDLERRLDEVAERLDQGVPETAFDSAGIMEAIDARFTALAHRLETRIPDQVGAATMREVESRLADISNRLESSASQVSGIDPDLIRSLEAQVASLSSHLNQPATPLPAFEDFGPRLGAIEKSISEHRDVILEAAREAAESAVRSLSGSDQAAATGLAQDLKTLEKLTRRSDERNAKTFEAIHDTLLKVVDRLGSLESREVDEADEESPVVPASKIAVRETPSIGMDDTLPFAEEDEFQLEATKLSQPALARTPAEAASAAALAALGSEAIAPNGEGARRKSMFGGFARAFSGRKEPDMPQLAGSAPVAEPPTLDLDEPLDPKIANRPLEPGSGTPDLNAIMRRVRDERGQPTTPAEAEVAKADFIAAARRAAQAAAAEADVLKKQSNLSGPVKALRLGDLLKARRKPILMAAAAIMMALAGLQLGKAFLSDPVQIAAVDSKPGIAAPAEDQATAVASEAATQGENTPVRVVDAKAPATPVPERAAPPKTFASTPSAVADAPPAPMAALPVPSEAAPSLPSASAEAKPVTETTASVPAAMPAQDEGAVATIEIPAEIGPLPLRDAAAAGDPKALFEIGSRYAEARGVKEDMASAAKWYERAAELGFAPAEYRIGNFYEKGIGVERDIGKSKTWYQLAAEQGNASAMHNLAVLFAMGNDGVTDNESAAHWFQAAADLGVKDSQFNLGILAAKGVGMPQNLEDSYKWFALVAKTGDKDAASKRDEIANALRPEQLERARSAVELWKAKPLDQATNSVDIPAAWQTDHSTTASIDMKKAVQNIQRILNKNGYDAGNADGMMGARTKNAIIAFQSDNGLDASGEVDEKLVKALLARK